MNYRKSITETAGKLARQGLSALGELQVVKEARATATPARALSWLHANELATGGIRAHSGEARACPAVTGGVVPTLLAYGESELAARLLRWLLCIQRADGSFVSEEGDAVPVVTGQVLRGLLAALDFEPRTRTAAHRAADYLVAQMVDDGRGGFALRYGDTTPTSVHLDILPALHQAAARLENEAYATAAAHCLAYYLNAPDSLRLGDPTHFLAPQLAALLELGHSENAVPILDKLRLSQRDDGAVMGQGGVNWISTPGLAQLAICWYRTGQTAAADHAMAWLDAQQRPTGGFWGSYGYGAPYFPSSEVAWAVKFYLDAHLLRLQSLAKSPSPPLARDDGWVQVIANLVQPHDHVLAVGDERGILSQLQNALPLETARLGLAPPFKAWAGATTGAITGGDAATIGEAAENAFDVVFAVESLRYVLDQQQVVEAMIYAAKPGGWVVVLDQRTGREGERLPAWQQWPEWANIREALQRGCEHVTVEQLGKTDESLAHLTLWRGRKRDASRVLQAINNLPNRANLVDAVRHHQLAPWAQAIILATEYGQSVLSIDSSLGEVSLQLAQAGRHVTVCADNAENLAVIHSGAQLLNVPLLTVPSDTAARLPFEDNEFHCTWSAGLLEYLTAGERQARLREWWRVTGGQLIILSPNAAAVAYRAGHTRQEAKGEWTAGPVVPLLSLRDDFAAAGLVLVSEFSVGTQQSLNFLPPLHPLRLALGQWMASLTEAELQSCNQGYCLVSIGTGSG